MSIRYQAERAAARVRRRLKRLAPQPSGRRKLEPIPGASQRLQVLSIRPTLGRRLWRRVRSQRVSMATTFQALGITLLVTLAGLGAYLEHTGQKPHYDVTPALPDAGPRSAPAKPGAKPSTTPVSGPIQPVDGAGPAAWTQDPPEVGPTTAPQTPASRRVDPPAPGGSTKVPPPPGGTHGGGPAPSTTVTVPSIPVTVTVPPVVDLPDVEEPAPEPTKSKHCPSGQHKKGNC